MSPTRSHVIRLADAEANLPGPAGEHAVAVFKRASLDVALSIPEHPIPQSPHEQNEIYVIIRGRGVLLHDGKRDAFEPGDLLLVDAGVEHQFEDVSDDLAVWRIFYGARSASS